MDLFLRCDREGCEYVSVQDKKLIQAHKAHCGNNGKNALHKSEPVDCDVCGRTFQSVGVLMNHLKAEHNASAAAQTEFQVAIQWFLVRLRSGGGNSIDSGHFSGRYWGHFLGQFWGHFS